MSRSDGVLRVVLTGRWFDMMERWEKLEEYRGVHWFERLTTEDAQGMLLRYLATDAVKYLRPQDFHHYHTLVASRGYTSQTLTRKIRRIRWGTPRPEWSGDTVTGECFVIELEGP